MYSTLASPFLIFEAMLVSMLLVLVFSWASIRLATHWQLIDVPNSAPHKQHKNPTPLAGGLALMAVLLICEFVFSGFAHRATRITFVAALVVFSLGLLDDYKSMPPSVKLCGQFLATLILIRLDLMIKIFDSPEFFIHVNPDIAYILNWVVTVLWVVGITNAFNFVDSMDGLAVGLGAMAAAFFMIVTLGSGQPAQALLSGIVVGACIGLYFFNSPPAMLFLGDSGAQTLGFILAVIAIVYRPQGANQSSSYLVPIMLLGVPIFDTALVVLSRLRRGQPIYTGARDHTYHRLLCLGFAPSRAVLVMQLAALALSCLAFVLLPQPPLVANVVFACAIVLGILILGLLDRQKDWYQRYHLDDSEKRGD